MSKMFFIWIGISHLMLFILHVTANNLILKDMLRKDLSMFQPEKGKGASGVEYIKLHFGPDSTQIASHYLALYQKEVFGLLINAMLADWELWLESIEQKQETLFYSLPWKRSKGETLKNKLLVAISREFQEDSVKPLMRSYGGIIRAEDKKREGDACKKALDDYSKEALLHLLEGQFVRIIDKLCIVAFAVIRNENALNNEFVKVKMYDHASHPETFLRNAHLIDSENELLWMMKEVPQGNEHGVIVEGKTLAVTFHKVLLHQESPLRVIPEKEILSLLDTSRLETWQPCVQKCMYTDIWDKHGSCEVRSSSYHEWPNHPGIIMMVAIYRTFKREAPTVRTSLLQEKRVKEMSIKEDKCKNIIHQEVLRNIKAHGSHYVHMSIHSKECIVSFGLVN